MIYASRKGVALIVAAVSTLVLVGCQPEETQKTSQAITIGQRFSVVSEVLGEEREYLVYLPRTYDDPLIAPKYYPVLYLLDGGPNFPWVSGVVQVMSSGINGVRQIPEMIVVAIPNTNRERDLTPTHSLIGIDGKEAEFRKVSGGGNEFLKFILDELFVEIESKYRTLQHRTLVGHSLGGLLALHALVEAPDMFQAYIAIDPSLWWDEQSLNRRAAEVFSTDRSRSGSVYISLANRPHLGPGERDIMGEAGREFAGILANAISQNIRFELQYFDSEDHGSVAPLSLYHGLLSIFDGFKIPIDVIIAQTMEVIIHFEQLSNQLGTEFLPPELLVNSYGHMFLKGFENPVTAVELFELNVANYPNSPNAYDSLGDGYVAIGNNILAIENYEKSLALYPEFAEAKRKLKKLKE